MEGNSVTGILYTSALGQLGTKTIDIYVKDNSAPKKEFGMKTNWHIKKWEFIKTHYQLTCNMRK